MFKDDGLNIPDSVGLVTLFYMFVFFFSFSLESVSGRKPPWYVGLIHSQ